MNEEELRVALKKYGKHLEGCELVRQPFFSGTDSHWECTCGYSKALDCKPCGGTGFMINKKIKSGFYSGFCFDCGQDLR